jgi:uncharacterized protein
VSSPTTERVARSVPTFSWSSPTQWSKQPKPVGLLVLGLVMFGVGDWMLIASHLGNSPWSVLSGGIDRHVHIGIGTITIITSVVVLVGWIPLRQRPGLGTIGNALIIGTVVEVLSRNVDDARTLPVRVAMLVGAMVIVGLGGALYLSTQLGPGPRDGLMTGLGRRLNRPIAHVRLAIEVTVMVVGWALGGRLGVGTLVYAFSIGHILAFFVARLHQLDHNRRMPSTIGA